MKTIAVFNQKGGVGKTTTAVTIARLWREHHPFVLDLDPQAATQNFLESLGTMRTECAKPNRAAYVLDREKSPLTIIDCPPDPEIAHKALERATTILIPVQTAFLSLRATYAAIEAMESKYPNANIRMVLTMFVPGKQHQRGVRDDARTEYARFMCKTIIARHSRIEEASERGLTILDTLPDSLPARQYQQLGAELWPD